MARTVPDHRSTSVKPADPVGLGVAAVGAAVVTAVCAVASYSHIEHLAQVAGQGELAGWLPLGVDGLVASSTASLLVDRRAGRPTGLSAVLGLALGLTGSLAANLVAVDPTLVSPRAVRLALAGYPPVALAIAGHVLLTMLLGPAVDSKRGKAGQNRARLRPGEAGATPAASLGTKKRPPEWGAVGPATGGVPSVEVRASRLDEVEGEAPAASLRRATLADARRIAAGRQLSGRALERAIQDEGLAVARRRATEWAAELARTAPDAPAGAPDEPGESRHLEVVAR